MDEKPADESKKFIKENVSVRCTRAEKLLLRLLKIVATGMIFGASALAAMVVLHPAAIRYVSSSEQNEASGVHEAESDSADTEQRTSEGSQDQGSEGGNSDTADTAHGSVASQNSNDGAKENTEDRAEDDTTLTQSYEGAGEADASQAAAAQTSPAHTPVSSSAQDTDDGTHESDDDSSCTAQELARVWQDVSRVGDDADRYIVDVCSVQNATDWFDNHFEKKDIYSGIIISASELEVCVLTPAAAVSSADSLRVVLSDGRLFPAKLKRSDTVTDMAVISFDPNDSDMVSAEIIEETTQAQSDAGHSEDAYEPIEAVPLDTVGDAARGDLVIAVGSPKGMTHSVAYTWLSYTTEPISVLDGTTRLFYTDRDISCDKGTWIMDLDGNFIGWLSADIQEDDTDSQVIMSIADYRDILAAMVNGEDHAYLGVSIIDTDTMHSGPDYPEGVYVKSVRFGGPAYASGLQPGDYIADIGGHRITSLRSFKYAMNHIQAGSTVTILIYRQSRDEYRNIVFEVETGLRTVR